MATGPRKVAGFLSLYRRVVARLREGLGNEVIYPRSGTREGPGHKLSNIFFFFFFLIGINFALYFGCNEIQMGEMNEWDCVCFLDTFRAYVADERMS